MLATLDSMADMFTFASAVHAKHTFGHNSRVHMKNPHTPLGMLADDEIYIKQTSTDMQSTSCSYCRR